MGFDALSNAVKTSIDAQVTMNQAQVTAQAELGEKLLNAPGQAKEWAETQASNAAQHRLSENTSIDGAADDQIAAAKRAQNEGPQAPAKAKVAVGGFQSQIDGGIGSASTVADEGLLAAEVAVDVVIATALTSTDLVAGVVNQAISVADAHSREQNPARWAQNVLGLLGAMLGPEGPRFNEGGEYQLRCQRRFRAGQGAAAF